MRQLPAICKRNRTRSQDVSDPPGRAWGEAPGPRGGSLTSWLLFGTRNARGKGRRATATTILLDWLRTSVVSKEWSDERCAPSPFATNDFTHPRIPSRADEHALGLRRVSRPPHRVGFLMEVEREDGREKRLPWVLFPCLFSHSTTATATVGLCAQASSRGWLDTSPSAPPWSRGKRTRRLSR